MWTMSSGRSHTPPAAGERRRAEWRDLAAACLSDAPPPVLTGIDVPAFLASAEDEGVVGLLYARLGGRGAIAALPPPLADGLRVGAHRQAARELAERAELQQIAAALSRRGLDFLLMKGAALAYDVYADPSWRVRADFDMLIRGSDREQVRACLETLGYRCEPEVSGRLVAYQFHATRIGGGRLRHLCDVHWKIANPQRFADAISFDELAAASIALPALGPSVRGLGRAHALWLACVHRVAHHYDQQTLLWLWDVHLLTSSLDAQQTAQFVELARRSRVRAICRRALRLAHDRFATPIPAAAIAALGSIEDEPSAAFLRAGMRRLDVLIDDLRALPEWRSRLVLLREVVCPDAVYMRQTYAAGSSAPLAWLYARRIVSGARSWLRRDARPTGRR